MARKVFFSFHYDDVKSFRVNVVRNSSMFKASGDTSRVMDASMWEEARLKGVADLKSPHQCKSERHFGNSGINWRSNP